jgi:hypothetical protein
MDESGGTDISAAMGERTRTWRLFLGLVRWHGAGLALLFAALLALVAHG